MFRITTHKEPECERLDGISSARQVSSIAWYWLSPGPVFNWTKCSQLQSTGHALSDIIGRQWSPTSRAPLHHFCTHIKEPTEFAPCAQNILHLHANETAAVFVCAAVRRHAFNSTLTMNSSDACERRALVTLPTNTLTYSHCLGCVVAAAAAALSLQSVSRSCWRV